MTKEEMQKIIGHNLMRQRLAQNITREQLSEKVGISTTFYANLECGNKMMSLVTLRKLADALCVSTDVILYGENTSGQIRSIEKLLGDQPEQYVAYIENVIRLTLNTFAQAENEDGEVRDQHECASAP